MRIPWQNNGPRILLSLSPSLPPFPRSSITPLDGSHGRHPPRASLRSMEGKRGRADETVRSRVKTPSGHPNSPPSSTFTRTFHVCWLRVEAWIISAHAQWRPSRRRVKTIAIVASRSVRRGTCSRTLPFVYLGISFQFPRARQSTKSFFSRGLFLSGLFFWFLKNRWYLWLSNIWELCRVWNRFWRIHVNSVVFRWSVIRLK